MRRNEKRAIEVWAESTEVPLRQSPRPLEGSPSATRYDTHNPHTGTRCSTAFSSFYAPVFRAWGVNVPRMMETWASECDVHLQHSPNTGSSSKQTRHSSQQVRVDDDDEPTQRRYAQQKDPTYLAQESFVSPKPKNPVSPRLKPEPAQLDEGPLAEALDTLLSTLLKDKIDKLGSIFKTMDERIARTEIAVTKTENGLARITKKRSDAHGAFEGWLASVERQCGLKVDEDVLAVKTAECERHIERYENTNDEIDDLDVPYEDAMQALRHYCPLHGGDIRTTVKSNT